MLASARARVGPCCSAIRIACARDKRGGIGAAGARAPLGLGYGGWSAYAACEVTVLASVSTAQRAAERVAPEGLMAARQCMAWSIEDDPVVSCVKWRAARRGVPGRARPARCLAPWRFAPWSGSVAVRPARRWSGSRSQRRSVEAQQGRSRRRAGRRPRGGLAQALGSARRATSGARCLVRIAVGAVAAV